MALNNKKEDVKDVKKEDLSQKVLLTEAEFEKKQRLKVKERINRITRVFGLFAILFLVYAGVFDPLFELSFIGAIFDKAAFNAGWDALRQLTIYDDIMWFGNWLGQLGFTILIVGLGVLIVYFLTYTIVDIIDVVKGLFEAGKDMTKDLSGNLKDTIIEKADVKKQEKKKPVKKSLFSGDDVKEDEVIKKEKRERKSSASVRRSENDEYSGLSSEQLDAILSGKNLEDVIGASEEKTDEIPLEQVVSTKNLFEE